MNIESLNNSIKRKRMEIKKLRECREVALKALQFYARYPFVFEQIDFKDPSKFTRIDNFKDEALNALKIIHSYNPNNYGKRFKKRSL